LSEEKSLYGAAGVRTQMVHDGVARLRNVLAGTFQFNDRARPATGLSFFAGLLDVGYHEYMAVSTDSVGTKLLVAQMMDKYDTIGIDCIAMNVNDVICVGATPVSVVDYIAVQEPDPDFLEQIAKGLYVGAEQSRVPISGGEVAQVGEIIKGIRPNRGFDLAATCVGLVPKDKVVVGKEVVPGDVILGLSSSGLHCNGYSLARKIAFDKMNFPVDKYIADLKRTVGEELLTPTHIYVQEVLEMLSDIETTKIKALVNITGDGLLNLNRIAAESVGFRVDTLPEPQPIFHLLKEWGNVSDEELYRVFNMGIGFCVIVPDDSASIARVADIAGEFGVSCQRIGTIIADEAKRVFVTEKGLVQDELFFKKQT